MDVTDIESPNVIDTTFFEGEQGFEFVPMDWPNIGVRRLERGVPQNTAGSVDFFTLAHQAGVLSEEEAQDIERKLQSKPIIEQRGGGLVSCAHDDQIVASTEICVKSILKAPTNLKSPQRKTSATVCFASPIISVSVIELETGEDECSEDTVTLSPEDSVMHYQEVPAFCEDVNGKKQQEPPPEKKSRLSEALLYNGVNNSSCHSLKRWPSFSLPDDEEMDAFKDTDISTEILGAKPKDTTCTERSAMTRELITKQGGVVVYNQAESVISPTSEKRENVEQEMCGHASRNSMDVNGLHNAEEVQVVPEPFSKQTITPISDERLGFCPSSLRLDETAFQEEEDESTPCQHLKCVPRLQDILDTDTSFYREDLNDVDILKSASFTAAPASLGPLEHLCSEFKGMEPSYSVYFDSFQKEMIEEMSDSQVSENWVPTFQVLTTTDMTGEAAAFCAAPTVSSQHFDNTESDDALSIDYRLQTKQEVGESPIQRPQMKHSAKIPDPEVVIQAPQAVLGKTTESPTLSRPLTINEQNFHKRLHLYTTERLPGVSSERAALLSSNIPQKRTKQREHGVRETGPETRQDSPVKQLCRQTPEGETLSLSSEATVRVPRREENLDRDSQILGSCVQHVEGSEQDEISPNTEQDPPALDHVLSPWFPRSVQSRECDSQTLGSDIQCIEPIGNGPLEYEATPSKKEEPCIQELCITPDAVPRPSSNKTALLSSIFYENEYGENSGSDSQSVGSYVERDDPEDVISPRMKQHPPVLQICVTPEVLPARRCHQDGECEGRSVSASQTSGSCVEHIEPAQSEPCGRENDNRRENVEPFVTQEKGYKNAHTALSQMDIDLDGPELLEFAMLLVKDALQKTQAEKPSKDKNTKFPVKVPSAFRWEGKLNHKHLVSETNSIDRENCAVLDNLARQENPTTAEETNSPPLVTMHNSNRPRRVGLSRRQKVKPLHPYLIKVRHRSSLRSSDD